MHFEMHLAALVPKQSIGRIACALDFKYPNLPIRLSVGFDSTLRLVLTLNSFTGTWAKLTHQELIDWSTPRHISLSHHLLEDLRSRLQIIVDGKTVSQWN